MAKEEKTIGGGPLLVVEDDPGLQKQLKWSFDDLEVVIAGDRAAALVAVRRHEPAVVTLDLGLPPDADGASEGLATLEQILALAPATKIIVVSGNQDRANAVQAAVFRFKLMQVHRAIYNQAQDFRLDRFAIKIICAGCHRLHCVRAILITRHHNNFSGRSQGQDLF